MIVIENGDLLEGDATSASEVDFVISGLDNNLPIQFADGQLANAKGTLYTANSTDIVSSIIFVNTGAAHNHVNLYSKSSGGTSRRLIPKDMQLEPGYSLHFDGLHVMVFDVNGGIVSGVNVSDVAYGASWDTVTTVAPSKNAVYDQMELRAPKLETIKSAGALAVLRRMRVTIRPGSAGTITAQLSSIYNGDVAAQSTDIAKGATVSPFTLDATGTVLLILDAGITGTLLAVLGDSIYGDNSNITSLGPVIYLNGTSISVSVRQNTSDTMIDMTTLGGGKYWQFDILYLTSE
jgi:hypothetical protein